MKTHGAKRHVDFVDRFRCERDIVVRIMISTVTVAAAMTAVANRHLSICDTV